MAVAVKEKKTKIKIEDVQFHNLRRIRKADDKKYNVEQKNRFKESINLQQYPKNYWDRLFAATCQYEKKFGKDIYNFNKVEIRSMYAHINYTSYETLMVDNYSLAKYTTWAIGKQLVDDGINHYMDFTQEELIHCTNLRQVKQSIVTREKILSSLNSINNAQDRFILLAIFEGIRGKEFEDLRNLRINDINISNNTASLSSGKTIHISNELKNLAVEANNETMYMNSKGLQLDLIGGYILKVTSIAYGKSGEDKKNKRNIYDSFLRSAAALGWSEQVSLNSLYTSGIIEMINRIAIENNMTSKDVLYNNEFFVDIANQYDFNPLIRKRFLLKYAELLQ